MSRVGFRLRPGLELIECHVAVTHDARSGDISEEWAGRTRWMIHEVMALRKFLRRYGDHLLCCDARLRPADTCTCGFREMQALLEECCDV